MSNHGTEIKNGNRFSFGENWSNFLEVVDEDRIHEAESSLQSMLGLERFDGLTFLDAGCGSGLFSLAAWRLGAKVYSFDYDPQSVATTQEIRRRYCTNEDLWKIETGSVLDIEFLNKLGQFDIVYSWGVLHHTGDMWQAMKNVISLVHPRGSLFIALYNDQGFRSRLWLKIKKTYCSSILRQLIIKFVFFPIFFLTGLASDLAQRKNPFKRYIEYRKKRGMSLIHDWIDWLGGYPFEVAKPEQVFDFYFNHGFHLAKMSTRQTLGCNEFVFIKDNDNPT